MAVMQEQATVEDYKPWWDEFVGKTSGLGSSIGRSIASNASRAIPAGSIAALIAALIGSEMAPTKAQKEAMEKDLYEIAKSGDPKARALWEKKVAEARAAIEKSFMEAGGSANLGRAFASDYTATVANSTGTSYNPAKPFLPSAGALGSAIASSGAGTMAGSMGTSYNPAKPFLPTAGALASVIDPVVTGTGATTVIDPVVTGTGATTVIDPATQAIGTSVIDPTKPFLPISGVIDPAQEIVGTNTIVDPIQGTLEDVTTDTTTDTTTGVAEGVISGTQTGTNTRTDTKDKVIPLPIPWIDEIIHTIGKERDDPVPPQPIPIDPTPVPPKPDPGPDPTPDPDPDPTPTPDPVPPIPIPPLPDDPYFDLWGNNGDDETDENTQGEYNMADIDWLKWLEENQAKQWAREDMIRKETQAREDSAYQRAVKDMYKAGINPNLMNVQPASAGGGITNATGINTGILEAQISSDTKLLEQMLEQAFKGDENSKDRFTGILGNLIQSIVTAMIFKG